MKACSLESHVWNSSKIAWASSSHLLRHAAMSTVDLQDGSQGCTPLELCRASSPRRSMAAMSDDSRLVGKSAIVHKNEDAWEGGALRC